MPSASRHLTGAELIPNPAIRQSFLEKVQEQLPDLDNHVWSQTVLSRAAQQVDIIKNATLRFVTFSGQTGFAEVLAVATRDLKQHDFDLALVGGMDSLVDERSLKWLKLTGRLKAEANPVGLEPGEAAVFLAVERRNSRRPMLSRIRSIAIGEEDRSQLLGQQATGKVLSNCVRATIDGSETLWLIADHNGEVARAMEFGNIQARLAGHIPDMAPPLFPAASFGDTGAASGAIAVCLAQNAFMRHYAPRTAALVASASDGPRRSAFCIIPS